MERVTIRTPKGAALIMGDVYMDERSAREDLKQRCRVAFDRLADYEDSGLTPEEIEEMARFMRNYFIDDWDRFSGIMQAEHDGRLVVLPPETGKATEKGETDE